MAELPELRRLGVAAALGLIWKERTPKGAAPFVKERARRRASVTRARWFPGARARARPAIRAVQTARNVLTLLDTARRGDLVSVPVSHCTNLYAFSYGTEGWHYFRDLAVELLEDPETPLEATRFYRFFQRCEFPSYTRLMAFHRPDLIGELPEIPFGSWPWGQWERTAAEDPRQFVDTSRNRRLRNYVWFEPGLDREAALRKEFTKISALLRSIRQHGYRISLSSYQVPGVVPMVARSGQVRFVQYGGAHRLAVRSALGHSRVILQLDRRCPPVLEDDVENWVYVRSGLVSRRAALQLFSLYFSLDGTERASRLLTHETGPVSRGPRG